MKNNWIVDQTLEFEQYSRYIDSLGRLTIEELNRLLTSSSELDKERFIMGYLRYVQRFAVKIYNLYSEYLENYSIMDLIEDGNLLLTQMIKTKKYKTYQIFTRYFYFKFCNIATTKFDFKISPTTVRKLLLIKNIEEKYYKEHGVLPNKQQLAEISGLSLKSIDSFYTILIRLVFLPNSTFENILVDNCFEDRIMKKIFDEDQTLHRDLMAALSKLSQRDKQIICKLYGILDEKMPNYNTTNETKTSVGKSFALSHERIRQIDVKVLEKIKNENPKLKVYLRG